MTLLLLAGTSEAQKLAQALATRGVRAVASLAGATRAPRDLPLPVRHGGFGGADGFATYLAAEGITAVLDATHPFAANITARTARVCAAQGVPYCLLLRPGWQAEPGDQWTFIDREEEAAAHIAPDETVFLATGRQTLSCFANLAPRKVWCRQIDPPEEPFPFEGGQFLVGRPPFSVVDETELFTQLGIDWLVVKNAGGTPSRTKLTAARDLGIPVLMLTRPSPPDAPKVSTVEAALDWVLAL
ncbi:cobalt-precorrin-6A reductase [Pseudohalocynthiibacter aestuariivivens]|nr:cobalt-precorrin-6A reductase [Pseudohalocynthiibacter aestuariivivens]QIE45953.1 cobalt-precorrin-6A reductase [Pseudohalocynthiibacter aestuariivivens]